MNTSSTWSSSVFAWPYFSVRRFTSALSGIRLPVVASTFICRAKKASTTVTAGDRGDHEPGMALGEVYKAVHELVHGWSSFMR